MRIAVVACFILFLRGCFGFSLLDLTLGFPVFLAFDELVAEIAHVLETRPYTGGFLIVAWHVLYEVGSEGEVVQSLPHGAAVSKITVDEPEQNENGSKREEDDGAGVIGLGQFLELGCDKNEANKCQKTGRVGEDTVEEQGLDPSPRTYFVRETN